MFELGATPATRGTFPLSAGSSAARRARVAPVETPTRATFPSSTSGRAEISRATCVVPSAVCGVILSSVKPGRSGTTTRYPARAKPSARFRTSGAFPHGPVDQEYGRPRSLPRRPHEERGVPSDTRLREAWISASGFDGWREHRRVENGGDHHDGTRLRVHPRPVRDEQPDQYRKQYEIEGAPEPSTGESLCRILALQRPSRRRRSHLPLNYATRITA